MYDPRTVYRRDIVTSDDTEGVPIGAHPGQ